MPTRFSKTRKHRGHVSAGYGRVGKHRKHPGGRGLAGGQHHHRTNFDKYHFGYFGKVGMRHFHLNKAALWRPVINVEKIATLVPEQQRQGLSKDSQTVPVVDTLQAVSLSLAIPSFSHDYSSDESTGLRQGFGKGQDRVPRHCQGAIRVTKGRDQDQGSRRRRQPRRIIDSRHTLLFSPTTCCTAFPHLIFRRHYLVAGPPSWSSSSSSCALIVLFGTLDLSSLKKTDTE